MTSLRRTNLVEWRPPSLLSELFNQSMEEWLISCFISPNTPKSPEMWNSVFILDKKKFNILQPSSLPLAVGNRDFLFVSDMVTCYINILMYMYTFCLSFTVVVPLGEENELSWHELTVCEGFGETILNFPTLFLCLLYWILCVQRIMIRFLLITSSHRPARCWALRWVLVKFSMCREKCKWGESR